MFEWSVGALTAPCKNAVSPNANLFPFLTRGDPLQYSFSANDNGYIQSFFGPTAPCLVGLGATPPTASTANTYLASVFCGSTGSGCQYREYGSYDSTYNYVSPSNTNNPNTYTTVLPSASDWATLGPMYSNAALTARPAGSMPLDASRALYVGGANVPTYTYTCSAKKLETITSGSASVASMWLLLAAAFAVAAVY